MIVPTSHNSHNFYFHQDRIPAHYLRAVTEYLDITGPEYWIGRRRPIDWSARLPELTPMIFFLFV